MSLEEKNITVLNAATFIWPTNADGPVTTGLSKYEKHLITVSGAGTATITCDQGSGSQAVDTLAADYNTYLLPNASTITIVASVANLVVSIKSYS